MLFQTFLNPLKFKWKFLIYYTLITRVTLAVLSNRQNGVLPQLDPSTDDRAHHVFCMPDEACDRRNVAMIDKCFMVCSIVQGRIKLLSTQHA